MHHKNLSHSTAGLAVDWGFLVEWDANDWQDSKSNARKKNNR